MEENGEELRGEGMGRNGEGKERNGRNQEEWGRKGTGGRLKLQNPYSCVQQSHCCSSSPRPSKQFLGAAQACQAAPGPGGRSPTPAPGAPVQHSSAPFPAMLQDQQ